MVVLFLETLAPLTLLAVLNFIAAKEYRLMDTSNIGLTNASIIQRRDAENRWTKLILIMTSVCIVKHLLDLVSALGQRIRGLGIYEITEEMSALISFFRQVTYLIIFSIHSFDGVFIFSMDSNLRKIGKKMLGSIQVRVISIQCLDEFVNN